VKFSWFSLSSQSVSQSAASQHENGRVRIYFAEVCRSFSGRCKQMADIQSATAEIRRGKKKKELEMWASAQRDGGPADHRWRALFNAAKFG